MGKGCSKEKKEQSGGGWSEEEQKIFAAKLFQSVQETPVMPDIGIDESILEYGGLNSYSVLDAYSSNLINDLIKKGSGFVKDLGSSLSSFSIIPNAVGLGALVISILLEMIIAGLKNTEDEADVPGMMQRVFAEEKASDVRDTMDEYIKRFSLKMYNPEELLSETERLEKQLSNELTKLRNSMLHDNQISTRSMKHWTNGAAFHMQMFIHKARMEVAKSGSSELDMQVWSACSLADHYGKDMNDLLTKYEAYKRSTIYTSTTTSSCFLSEGGFALTEFSCGHFDSELKTHAGFKNDLDQGGCIALKETYQNYMFENWKLLKELREYFPSIKQNLQETIKQDTTFSIKKFLPAPEGNDRTEN